MQRHSGPHIPVRAFASARQPRARTPAHSAAMRCFGMVEIVFAPFAQTPNDASEADIIRNVGVTSWAACCRARGVRLQVQGHHGPAIPQGTPSRGGNAMVMPWDIH